MRRILAAFAVLAALTGCEGEPDAGPPPVVRTQEMVDAQIEKIKNDPNMTAQAKEAAIRGMQAGFEAGKRQAESAAKNPVRKP